MPAGISRVRHLGILQGARLHVPPSLRVQSVQRQVPSRVRCTQLSLSHMVTWTALSMVGHASTTQVDAHAGWHQQSSTFRYFTRHVVPDGWRKKWLSILLTAATAASGNSQVITSNGVGAASMAAPGAQQCLLPATAAPHNLSASMWAQASSPLSTPWPQSQSASAAPYVSSVHTLLHPSGWEVSSMSQTFASDCGSMMSTAWLPKHTAPIAHLAPQWTRKFRLLRRPMCRRRRLRSPARSTAYTVPALPTVLLLRCSLLAARPCVEQGAGHSSITAGAPDFAVAAAPPSLPPTLCIGGRRRQRDGTQRDRKRGHRKLRCRWHTGGSRPRGRVVTVGLQHFGRICELGEGSLDRSAPG